MPDPRFFEARGPIRLGALAELTGARVEGARADSSILGVSVLTLAGPTEVAFFAQARHLGDFAATRAGACFVAPGVHLQAADGCVMLVAPRPQAAWAIAAQRLHRPLTYWVQDEAIAPTAMLEEGVTVGSGAVIGPGAMIGRGTSIAPGAVIGAGVAIGRDGYVGAHASVGFALIGDGVRIYAGARIGEPGFGAVLGPKGLLDVPQLGRVIIQDAVTVGAGTCIDRGAFEDTVIGENTKIDNLVQIAHNVVIGRNCALAAFSGISGSVVLGEGCQLGGRAGITDHITVGNGVRIAANSGVMTDVPAGQSWGGSPARPARQWLREAAWVTHMSRRRGRGG